MTMDESTLSLSAEQIGKSRSLLCEGWELDLGVVDSLCDQAIEALTLRAALAAEIERRELADTVRVQLANDSQMHLDRALVAERALAEAQECIEQKDASLLRGADAMTKDAEFIRSLKAELAAYRAPVGDVEVHVEHHVTAGDEFTDGMGGPEHRELFPADIARQLAATVRERDERIAGLISVLERLNRKGGLGLDVHSWIDAALTQPTGRKEQS